MRVSRVIALAACVISSVSTGVSGQDRGKDPYAALRPLVEGVDAATQLPGEVLANKAFEALMESTFPLTHEQLRTYKAAERQYETIINERPVLDIETGITDVSIRPGAKPPTIKVAQGSPSTFSVIDSTGQPWPIVEIVIDSAYEAVQLSAHVYSNAFRVTPHFNTGGTTMSLMLADMATAIPISLINADDSYSPNPVLQIDGMGPLAKPVDTPSLGGTFDETALGRAVIGLPPEGAKKVKTSDPEVEAWEGGEHMYIRTRYTPSSPLSRGIKHGPQDFKAYEMQKMPVYIMTTARGESKKIVIGKGVQYGG